MLQRPTGVRVVQVGPDGRLLNYQGASEQEAAVRLFDKSERTLSALAGRLLESLANDAGQTQGRSASRSTSGWWNGQPVEGESRNNALPGQNITSTPQKQPDQAGDVPQPLRPSKVSNQESSTRSELMHRLPHVRLQDATAQSSSPSHLAAEHGCSARQRYWGT